MSSELVNDGRVSNLPIYKNTAHAIFAIARLEGLKGLYAGFFPSVLGSTVSWGLYFFFYGRAKQRYSKNRDEKLSPGLHLASAAEAGALQVSHGAIQFTAYEELRKVIVDYKSKESKRNHKTTDADLLQRPGTDGFPKYTDSWHVVKETARFEVFEVFTRASHQTF
ncbi:hypothetical protein GH714_034317 [Hevea brasiliensis]|uniref:Uncharacterized protein n=1 Tax=Hevea brasiliensis TaxID=3981 RepID=A0A6A6MHD4_HEVBR|nr:hypothetical protein GH714_034317 [Hevea brasiliensis]